MSELQTLRSLTADGRLILLSRSLRLFAFGAISVILVLYFAASGWSEVEIGRLLALTMFGDAAVTLWVTLNADRIGRVRMLQLSALLMVLVGILLPSTQNGWLVALLVFVGAISLNGGEVGPFLAIEQAGLTNTLNSRNRTTVIAWYTLCGALATAIGALVSGVLAQFLRSIGYQELASYRAIFFLYAICGVLLWLLFRNLSSAIETESSPSDKVTLQVKLASRFGLHKSRSIVLGLSALFMIDTFGSGLVVQSYLSHWLHEKFQIDTGVIGSIFFGMSFFAAFSALVAGRLALRIGLINTMVWTHIPANFLLIALPLAPILPIAILILLLRGCLSQMDIPARQSYLMAVVDPDERSAAGGVTGLARSIASALSPPITGMLFAAGWLSTPFFIAGGLKIIYDLALWRSFGAIKPPEEKVL
ncbi:MAG: MFS transporter [Caldilineaceae bacterium]